jgi:hypothetical protein
MLVKVSAPSQSDPICNGGTSIAAAASYMFERGTNRPVFAEIMLCKFDATQLWNDLQFASHELIHALVRLYPVEATLVVSFLCCHLRFNNKCPSLQSLVHLPKAPTRPHFCLHALCAGALLAAKPQTNTSHLSRHWQVCSMR